ncbi:MAG: hypothetical protein WD825_08235 [Gemmatimonadaceae bacterium]
MGRFGAGCAALAALAFAAACAKDSSSSEVAAPDATSELASAQARNANLASDAHHHRISAVDDCDPRDLTWAAIGGCTLTRGFVTRAEFDGELNSPLSPTTVVGHPSWRNEPSYAFIKTGQSVEVRNIGGRQHTFTEVAQFGGGRVPPLSRGLVPAPECLRPTEDLESGDNMQVSGLAPGSHRFQCCIHPWMRALIEVAEK